MTVRMRPRRSARITLATIALLCAASGLAGQETVIREFRFSSDLPSRSVLVDLPYATISVEGWAGDSVRVALTPEAARRRELPPVSLAEGRLVVADPGNQELLDVIVRVPRDADVSVRGSNAGDVTISDMHGNLEIENSNGGILISGSRGGVVAATSNGPIVAEVERMPEYAPLSFLTSNDSVRIVLPADADAELYLETDNAVVRTDFDVVSGRPAQAPPAPGHPRTVRGRLGEGGAVLRVRTDNGDIVVRRGPPQAAAAPRGGGG